MRTFVRKKTDKAVKDTLYVYENDDYKVVLDGNWVEISKNGKTVYSGNTTARNGREAFEIAKRQRLIDGEDEEIRKLANEIRVPEKVLRNYMNFEGLTLKEVYDIYEKVGFDPAKMTKMYDSYDKKEDSSIKDLYSLQELKEMRVAQHPNSEGHNTDIYKIEGKYSTNPNTSNKRFNTLEEVKKYIENDFRDSSEELIEDSSYSELRNAIKHWANEGKLSEDIISLVKKYYPNSTLKERQEAFEEATNIKFAERMFDAKPVDMKALVNDIVQNDRIRISSWNSDGEITMDTNQLFSSDVNTLCRAIKQRGYNCEVVGNRTVKIKDNENTNLEDSYIYSDVGQDYNNIISDIKSHGLDVQIMGNSNGGGKYIRVNGTKQQLEKLKEMGYFENEIIHDSSVKDDQYDNEKKILSEKWVGKTAQEVASMLKKVGLTYLVNTYDLSKMRKQISFTDKDHKNNLILLFSLTKDGKEDKVLKAELNYRFIDEKIDDSALSNAYSEIKKFYPNAELFTTTKNGIGAIVIKNAGSLGSGIKQFLTNINKKYGRSHAGFGGRPTDEIEIVGNEAVVFIKDSAIKDYSVKHKGKQYIVRATSEKDAALKVARKK